MLQNLLTVEANKVGSQKKWIKREGDQTQEDGEEGKRWWRWGVKTMAKGNARWFWEEPRQD